MTEKLPLWRVLIRKIAKSPEEEARLVDAAIRRVEADKALETLGLATWQLKNKRLEAMRQPYVLTPDEFAAIVLPAVAHAADLPDDWRSPRVSAFLFRCASLDWRERGPALDALLGSCDARPLSDFLMGMRSAYCALKQSERNGVERIAALWPGRCEHCSTIEQSEFSVSELLGQFRAGRYELAHIARDDEGEVCAMCPGPFLSPSLF